MADPAANVYDEYDTMDAQPGDEPVADDHVPQKLPTTGAFKTSCYLTKYEKARILGIHFIDCPKVCLRKFFLFE